MCQHLLAVSELKAQRLSQRVLVHILDLSRNLILTARMNSQTLSATLDLIGALAQKRQKLGQFRVDVQADGELALQMRLNQSNDFLILTLSIVMRDVDQVIAPRREKYQLQGNTLAHYSSEYKSRCIDYHRQMLLQTYTIEDKIQSHTVTWKEETKHFD